MSSEGRLRRGKLYAEKGVDNAEAKEYLDSIKPIEKSIKSKEKK